MTGKERGILRQIDERLARIEQELGIEPEEETPEDEAEEKPKPKKPKPKKEAD